MSQSFTRNVPIDPDSTFAANSDFIVPSQKAVKTIYDSVNVANGAYVKTALNASGSAPIYACRAWVCFDGTGTPAIKASGNVTSLTDNGTGDWTINFTTAISDANYSVVASSTRASTTYPTFVCVDSNGTTGAVVAPTTSAVRVNSITTQTSAAIDVTYVKVAIFR